MVDHSPFALATAVALPEATPISPKTFTSERRAFPEGDMVTTYVEFGP
jgi:hypothetical protein